MKNLVPVPASVVTHGGVFTLPASARIICGNEKAALAIAGQIADSLRPSTGFALPVVPTGETPRNGDISLLLSAASKTGEEGYELQVTPQNITIRAEKPAGLFYGAQTLRQLFPPVLEKHAKQSGPWQVETGVIRDAPRYTWRGLMLDVARHFFGVQDVFCCIDWMAYHKLNRLHLHLSDDQGWRIMIRSWENLALHGGKNQVGGGKGGYYSQEEYAEIIAYAQSKFITVVPEIDMPGHTNAALASYPELNADGRAPELYSGIEVGFSSLCVDKETTYRFVEAVIGELAAMTPGAYIHIGGDEAAATQKDDYLKFINRVQDIVKAHGKSMIGWEEISQVPLLPGTLVQYWKEEETIKKAAAQGVKVILSPANRIYLDMKYNRRSKLGLAWAGTVSVRKAYDWEPAALVDGITDEHIIGVEAPLWTETLENIRDIETMLFPRLAGCAEIAWSPAALRSWKDYRVRLKHHCERLKHMDVNFYGGK